MLIGSPCGRMLSSNKRCEGIMDSALRAEDWERCPSCSALGQVAEETCSECSGEGWIFVRDQPPWMRKRKVGK